jgi:hypothetical protein
LPDQTLPGARGHQPTTAPNEPPSGKYLVEKRFPVTLTSCAPGEPEQSAGYPPAHMTCPEPASQLPSMVALTIGPFWL